MDLHGAAVYPSPMAQQPQRTTPAAFIAKWTPVELSERAASHEHFIDLCRLLGQPTPAEHDATGAEYTFEKGVAVTDTASRGSAGERGFADVWWRGKFAWEYKRRGKYRDLTEAYRQLCQYREALENPPLLIVSDIARTEIHTNFTGTAKQIHAVTLDELADPRGLDLLRRVFTDPCSFRPDLTAERVTRDVAERFGRLAQALRSRGHDPQASAHFLMKCMFCLFAEDVGLLRGNLFTNVLKGYRKEPPKLTDRLTELFDKMATGGDFGADSVAYFNGGLFDKAPALRLTAADIDVLLAAAGQDWGSVEPAIFGTLFERSLDPDTRAQIGAHYTSRDDIMLVVEPVVMAPLRREWEVVKDNVDELLTKRRRRRKELGPAKRIRKGTRPEQTPEDRAIAKLIHDFVQRLAAVRILDPACGSGNFLYVAIQQLLDLEKEVITFAARPEIQIGLFPQVRPTQLHGIEINPYAAELAQVVIWIGYLQWMRDNGFIEGVRKPILEPLQTIECRDAILEFVPDSMPEPPHSCGADSAGREDPDHADTSPHACHSAEKGRGGDYLLTWTTYATWLPGDERGFVGRVPDGKGGHMIHNLPGEPYDADEPRLRADASRKTKGAPVRLTADHARVCVHAFREVSEKYGLTIHAGAVMANHVHLVVTSDEAEGPRLLNLFKGVSSRRLGQSFGTQPSGSWWTTGGSRRLLPNERAFDDAVNYVRNQEYQLATCETTPPDVRPPSMPPGVNAGARAGDAGPRAVPATWPEADFIVGNPPFLGSKLFRQQGLEDSYIDAMFTAFDLPNPSDLCCYWFELARQAIERNPDTRAGLLATQGIRGGANRTVLERIKTSGDIFMAWSDRQWILDGAAVHVSIVGFDSGAETGRQLDGLFVSTVNANLTAHADLTVATQLVSTQQIRWSVGTQKGGDFDMDWPTARQILTAPSVTTEPILRVVRPWLSGIDVTKRRRGKWIIYFDPEKNMSDCARFERPFEYARQHVKPFRDTVRRESYRKNWWLHQEPRAGLDGSLRQLSRFIATPMVTKYRVFAWFESPMIPDKQVTVFCRADDYFFGVLHSSIHELWARRMGTQLREVESGFRYTPTTCFETFPLPWAPGKEPPPTTEVATSSSSDTPSPDFGIPSPSPGSPCPSPRIHAGRTPPDVITAAHAANAAVQLYQRISDAARDLNEQRERWLNPPEWIEPIAATVDAEDDFSDVPPEARELIRQSAIMARAAQDKNLKRRTLTNLYNERPTWLRLAHERLDRAVLAAYAAVDPEGDWSPDWAEVWLETGAGQPLPPDHPLAPRPHETGQRVLANLLRLNLARAGTS